MRRILEPLARFERSGWSFWGPIDGFARRHTGVVLALIVVVGLVILYLVGGEQAIYGAFR